MATSILFYHLAINKKRCGHQISIYDLHSELIQIILNVICIRYPLHICLPSMCLTYLSVVFLDHSKFFSSAFVIHLSALSNPSSETVFFAPYSHSPTSILPAPNFSAQLFFKDAVLRSFPPHSPCLPVSPQAVLRRTVPFTQHPRLGYGNSRAMQLCLKPSGR